MGEQSVFTTANAAISNVSGDRREILLRQQSSARYFQRPDRGPARGGFFSNRLDTMATSLRGAGAYARIAKETGDWTWETSVNTRTPGFETNDYAFQQSADYIWYNANLNRFWSKQTKWYQSMFGILGMQSQTNYEGDRTATQVHEFLNFTTRQFWNITEFLIVRPSAVDDRQLRGGPVVRQPSSQYGVLNVSTDSRHIVTLAADLEHYSDQLGGRASTIGLTTGIRPAPNISVSFGPSWNPPRLQAQYVTAVADPVATAFYGTRYVVSSLHQQTPGFDTRLSWTFSPRMTLEALHAAILRRGALLRLREYVAPRSPRCACLGETWGR